MTLTASLEGKTTVSTVHIRLKDRQWIVVMHDVITIVDQIYDQCNYNRA